MKMFFSKKSVFFGIDLVGDADRHRAGPVLVKPVVF